MARGGTTGSADVGIAHHERYELGHIKEQRAVAVFLGMTARTGVIVGVPPRQIFSVVGEEDGERVLVGKSESGSRPPCAGGWRQPRGRPPGST